MPSADGNTGKGGRLCLLGFGFYWAWFDFFRIADSHLLPLPPDPSVLAFSRIFTTLGFCLGSLVVALASRRIGTLCGRPRFLLGTIVFETAASLLFYGSLWGLEATSAVFLGTSAALGAGIVPLFMAWFELYSRRDSGWGGTVIPACLLLNAALLLLLTAFHFVAPMPPVAIMHIVLLWISLGMLLLGIKTRRESGLCMPDPAAASSYGEGSVDRFAQNPGTPFRFPAMLFFAVLAFGFLFGFMLELPSNIAAGEHLGIGLEAVGIAVAAGTFLVAFLVGSKRHSGSGALSLRPVITPFTILGVLLLPIIGFQIPFLVTTVFWIGYDYVDLLTMFIYVQMARQLNAPALTVNSQGQFADSLGIGLGMIAGFAVAPFVVENEGLLPIVSTAAVMLIIVLSMWVMTDRNIATFWGLKKLEPAAFKRSTFEHAVDSYAEGRRLTTRERDVLRRLLMRETPQSIADDLVISLSTVRSHIKGIYAKCDVHSKEELVQSFRAAEGIAAFPPEVGPDLFKGAGSARDELQHLR